MTLGDQISQVRYLGRLTSSSVADAQIITALNNGFHTFAVKVNGIPTHSYVSLLPRFDVETNYGFRVITDSASASFACTSVTLSYATGSTVAGKIETQVKTTWASATFSWSTATWRYTLTIPGATSIQIKDATAVKYVNAVPLIFGAGDTKAASTWTSTFAEGCTMEASLPAAYLAMDKVQWNIWTLEEAPFDLFSRPIYSGQPEWYGVRGKKIRIYPAPTSQEYFRIDYKGLPTDYGTTTSTTCPLVSEYQMAPVYFAVSELAEGTPDPTLANRFLQRFSDMSRDYIVKNANQSPKSRTAISGRRMNLTFRVGDLSGSN